MRKAPRGRWPRRTSVGAAVRTLARRAKAVASCSSSGYANVLHCDRMLAVVVVYVSCACGVPVTVRAVSDTIVTRTERMLREYTCGVGEYDVWCILYGPRYEPTRRA